MNSLEQSVKQALDERARHLDAATLSRLHVARNAALATRRQWWRNPLLQLAAGSAAAALALLMSFNTWIAGQAFQPPVESLELMEIIDLEADLDLVEELEFYDWLESRDENGADA